MALIYAVARWDELYENHRTRGLKTFQGVLIPNRFDGDGYTQIFAREDGIAIYGAWVLILQVASRCNPRGVLLRGPMIAGSSKIANPPDLEGLAARRAHDGGSLSRITRCPIEVMTTALDVLTEIGWLSVSTIPDNDLQQPTNMGGVGSAVIPRNTAGKRRETAVSFNLVSLDRSKIDPTTSIVQPAESENSERYEEFKQKTFSVLDNKFRTRAMYDSFLGWFRHLAKAGKPPFDPMEAAVRLARVFGDPLELQRAIDLAICNGWVSLDNRRNPPRPAQESTEPEKRPIRLL